MPSWINYRSWSALILSLTLVPIAAAEDIPVFIVAGQSNAVGFATDSLQLTLAQQTVQPHVLYPGQPQFPVVVPNINWAPLQPPTEDSTQTTSGRGFGPEVSAPLTISNGLAGQKVAAIKWAVNDSGLRIETGADDWHPSSGEIYSSMVSQVNTSLTQLPIQQSGTTGTVSGFFWMQGEKDSFDTDRADVYQYNLTQLIASVRAEFGDPNLPFVIGQIENAGSYTDTIRRAQANVAKYVPNTALVQTSDLAHDIGSPVHLTSQGTYDLGVRMGQAYLSLTGPALPAGPASMNLVVNGGFEGYAVSQYAGFPTAAPVGSGTFYPSNPMPGWTGATSDGHTLVNSAGFGPASEGQQFLSLENRAFGTGDGGAQQSVNTIDNQPYTIWFDYSAIAFGTNETVGFTADFGGAGTQTINVNTTGLGQTEMAPWNTASFTVTATSTAARSLRFKDVSTLNQGFFGPAIDNVRIVEGPVWNLAGGGTWTTNGNWLGGSDPDGNIDNANFLWRNTGAASINLTSDREVRSLRFDSANGYTIATSNGSALDLNHSVNGQNATILVGSGSHSINVRLDLEDSLDVDVAGSSSLTINGQLAEITSPRTLRKFGAGDLTFTAGNNTYTGVTHVVEGTLRLVHASDTNNIQSSSSIIVYRGATLDVTGQGAGGGITLAANQDLLGAGTVRGAVTATNSGINITPGNSPGILTFAGSGAITLATTTVIDIEVGGTGSDKGIAGVNYDQLLIDGDGGGKSFITGNARLSLTLLPGLVTGQAYTIISAVDGASINFTNLLRNLSGDLLNNTNASEGGYQYFLNYSGSAITVTFLTPEPSSLSTLILGALAMRRRRRR